MRDIRAPRYECSVDACVNTFLNIVFPPDGGFQVCAHHRVREEVDVGEPPEARNHFASVVHDWMERMRASEKDSDSQEATRDFLKELAKSSISQSKSNQSSCSGSP